MTKVITSFLITEEKLQMLDKAASEVGLNRSKVLRSLVDRFLTEVEEKDSAMVQAKALDSAP